MWNIKIEKSTNDDDDVMWWWSSYFDLYCFSFSFCTFQYFTIHDVTPSWNGWRHSLFLNFLFARNLGGFPERMINSAPMADHPHNKTGVPQSKLIIISLCITGGGGRGICRRPHFAILLPQKVTRFCNKTDGLDGSDGKWVLATPNLSTLRMIERAKPDRGERGFWAFQWWREAMDGWMIMNERITKP
jgi:hypothetical protein